VHTLEHCIPRVTMSAAIIYNPLRNVNGCLFYRWKVGWYYPIVCISTIDEKLSRFSLMFVNVAI
jgi:hypothetical protein